MSLTTLPYLLAFSAQGEAWHFTGFLLGVEDGNSYIAKMLRGAAGDFLFRTPYTAYPQHGALAFLPYLLLGKLSAPPAQHEQLVALFHLYRFAAGILAILATDAFLGYFLPQRNWRRWALVLVTLGGGLGWLVMLSGGPAPGWRNLPLEFYSPESFGFLALYGLPHLAMARALLLWGWLALLREHPCRAGLLWLAMGFFQPMTIVVGWAVLGAWTILPVLGDISRARRGIPFPRKARRTTLQRAAVVTGISSPPVLYTALTFSRDPTLRAWTAQNIIASPPPLQYLLAYGLTLPFLGLFLWRRRAGERPPQTGPLLAWVFLLPFLVYAPYNLQRRLAEGGWVALVTLAALGAQTRLSLRRFQFVTALLLPSTLLLLAGGVLSALRPAPPLFIPAAEAAFFEESAALVAPNDVVLTSYETGNLLPAWIPAFVVVGHGPESVHLAALAPRVAAFYAAETPDNLRRALLEAFNVRWVVWGPAERALGDADLSRMPFLRLAGGEGGYSLWEVVEMQNEE